MTDEDQNQAGWGVFARLAAIQPHQWVAAGVAVAAIGGIGGLFFAEALYGYWKPDPIVVYFKNWESDRGIEEAVAAREAEAELRAETEALADRLAAEALAGIEGEGAEAAPATDESAPE